MSTVPSAPTAPAPIICYADLISDPRWPGVRFLLPYNPELHGPVGGLGYSIPAVIVAPGTPPEDVRQAVEHVGRTFQLLKHLRPVLKAWLASDEPWSLDPGLLQDKQRGRRHLAAVRR